jgi:hypothetical protein
MGNGVEGDRSLDKDAVTDSYSRIVVASKFEDISTADSIQERVDKNLFLNARSVLILTSKRRFYKSIIVTLIVKVVQTFGKAIE